LDKYGLNYIEVYLLTDEQYAQIQKGTLNYNDIEVTATPFTVSTDIELEENADKTKAVFHRTPEKVKMDPNFEKSGKIKTFNIKR
jgi:hypothetical protein